MLPDAGTRGEKVERTSLKGYTLASVAAAVLTIALKAAAYGVTGSVGLLSDALESVVNLIAALAALAAIVIAAKPEDEEHAYGHTKVEYFASGFEGGLILVAALTIAVTAGTRLLDPRPLEEVWLGLAMVGAASLINLGVARVLMAAGRRAGSIVLEADAHHLMTDVWTSAAVIVGVAVSSVTGWLWLDPLLALLVAANILRIGVGLMRRSADGLLDSALPESERARIATVLRAYEVDGVHFHALRTRQAGTRRFVSFHILVPGEWSVQRGHDLLERIEAEVRRTVPNASVFTHLEPLEDPVSWADLGLERAQPEADPTDPHRGPGG
jgi:cation diffusion facilitator family transporter